MATLQILNYTEPNYLKIQGYPSAATGDLETNMHLLYKLTVNELN